MNTKMCIIGQMATGKTTLFKQLQESELKDVYEFFIESTTRPMREGEQNGIEYNFLTDEEFGEKESSGELVCVTKFDTAFGEWKYGIPKEFFDSTSLAIIITNPKAIKMMQDEAIRGDNAIYTIGLVCDVQTQLQRLKCRKDDYDETVRRPGNVKAWNNRKSR